MLGIEVWLEQVEARRGKKDLPLVSLCYAQSLDGSIALCGGRQAAISGPESSQLTHWLRSAHDAILVGVGTVLADNPLLTVRLVEGKNPQPVILDSRLRTPPTANLLQSSSSRAWIATTSRADPEKRAALEASGARMLLLPPDSLGRVDITALLKCLGEMGISKLMVEGGAQVITSFLSDRMADLVVLTIAPWFLGGKPAIQEGHLTQDKGAHISGFPHLKDPAWARLGEDLIVWGELS